MLETQLVIFNTNSQIANRFLIGLIPSNGWLNHLGQRTGSQLDQFGLGRERTLLAGWRAKSGVPDWPIWLDWAPPSDQQAGKVAVGRV